MNDAVTATAAAAAEAAAAAAAAADHRVAAKCARTNQFNLGNFQVVLSRENKREEKRKWKLILRRLATSVRTVVFSIFHNVRLQSPLPPKEGDVHPRCCPRHCKYFRLNSHLIFINGDDCAQPAVLRGRILFSGVVSIRDRGSRAQRKKERYP